MTYGAHWFVVFLACVLVGFVGFLAGRSRPPLPAGVVVLLAKLELLESRLSHGVAVQGGVSTIIAARELIASLYQRRRAA